MDSDTSEPIACSDKWREAVAQGSDNPHQQGVCTSETSLTQVVEDAIRHLVGSKYETITPGNFRFAITSPWTTSWRAQGIVYEADKFLEFNIFVTDDLYPEDRRAWVAELASRMTDTIPAGAFIFRYDEGDTRLRVVRTFREGEAITPEAIISLLETTAFPLKLWQRAFSYRHDLALGPQDALEIALVAEEVDDGSGLTIAATRAILRLETAPEDAFHSGQPSEPAIPTVLKLVGVENEGSDNGEAEQAAVLTSYRTSAAPPDEESTFSRLMNSRVAQEVRKPDGQIAAVVVFNSDVTEPDANELLFLLSDHWESANVQSFNPAYGRPVLWFA